MEEEDVGEDTRLLSKPLPKLDLPPRVHLQKACQADLGIVVVSVALAMSTWNSFDVDWHQVSSQSEYIYQQWRRKVWQICIWNCGTCMDASEPKGRAPSQRALRGNENSNKSLKLVKFQ